jgi:hypothetical protein
MLWENFRTVLEIKGLDILGGKERTIGTFIWSSQHGGYKTASACPTNNIEVVCKSCILTIQLLPQNYTNFMLIKCFCIVYVACMLFYIMEYLIHMYMHACYVKQDNIRKRKKRHVLLSCQVSTYT